MFKFFNTLDSPVQYDTNGRTVDGFSWLEVKSKTRLINSAVERGDLLEFDSSGNILYDNVDNVYESDDEPSDPGEPLSPEDANKRTLKKKLEG